MSSRKAVSPVVATFLIFAVSLIAAVAIFGYVFGIFGGISGIRVDITPEIYNPEANLGVLNEQANFTATITNSLPTPQNGVLLVMDSNHTVQRVPFQVGSDATSRRVMSQELDGVGFWTVEAAVNGSIVPRSYSFQVVVDTQEAIFQVNQYRLASQSNYLALAALCVSIISAGVAIAAYTRPRHSKPQA